MVLFDNKDIWEQHLEMSYVFIIECFSFRCKTGQMRFFNFFSDSKF